MAALLGQEATEVGSTLGSAMPRPGVIGYDGFKVIVNIADFAGQGKRMTAKSYVQIDESRLFKPITEHFKMLNQSKPKSEW